MDEDRLKKFGNHIRILRESEGMTQEELAKKSGFAGRAAISAIEKGKNNISVDKLPDLAIALRTTPGALLDVLVETSEKTITDGLSPENIAKLKSYADYLRASQE
jgi:transcriptional regulator with XRE-family HTH domain